MLVLYVQKPSAILQPKFGSKKSVHEMAHVAWARPVPTASVKKGRGYSMECYDRRPAAQGLHCSPALSTHHLLPSPSSSSPSFLFLSLLPHCPSPSTHSRSSPLPAMQRSRPQRLEMAVPGTATLSPIQQLSQGPVSEQQFRDKILENLE